MDFEQVLRVVSSGAIPVLLAVTLHEVAHGRVARAFGDPTAQSLGRLSLNPLKHVDPFGTIILPVLLFAIGSPFLFGWAKPVPVDARYFRHPRRDMAVVAIAGPAANILMAILWTILAGCAVTGRFGAGALRDWLLAMGEIGLFFNVLLAVFNLLPIPPLDGGRVLVGVLPARAAYAVARVEPYGLWIVIALLMLSNRTGVSLAPLAARVSLWIAELFS